MASNSFELSGALLLVVVATMSLASPVMDRIELAAADLASLNELVFARGEVGVKDVVKAYKAYVDLYGMQTEMAAVPSNGGGGSDQDNGDESAYKRIKQVLDAPGMDILAGIFFRPLHDTQTVGARQNAKIERLIETMKRQLY